MRHPSIELMHEQRNIIVQSTNTLKNSAVHKINVSDGRKYNSVYIGVKDMIVMRLACIVVYFKA